MSDELRIKFTGLCLFLPHEEGKTVTVFLPDATRPRRLLDRSDFPKLEDEHELRLVVREDGGSRIRRYRPRLETQRPPDRGTLRFAHKESADAIGGSVRERKDLAPLSGMVQSHPVCQGPLSEDLRSDLGRIVFETGRLLEENEEDPNELNSRLKWEIEPTIPEETTIEGRVTLSWIVTWTLDLANLSEVPDLVLESEGGDSNGSDDTTLKELLEDRGHREIEIWHVEEEHLPERGRKPECAQPGEEAADFRWYYFLLEDRRRLIELARDHGHKKRLPAPKVPNDMTAKDIDEACQKAEHTHNCLPGGGG